MQSFTLNFSGLKQEKSFIIFHIFCGSRQGTSWRACPCSAMSGFQKIWRLRAEIICRLICSHAWYVGWRPSWSLHVVSSCGLNFLTTWWLGSQVSQERARKKPHCFLWRSLRNHALLSVCFLRQSLDSPSQGRGAKNPSLDKEMSVSWYKETLCAAGYISVQPSSENVICHRI